MTLPPTIPNAIPASWPTPDQWRENSPIIGYAPSRCLRPGMMVLSDTEPEGWGPWEILTVLSVDFDLFAGVVTVEWHADKPRPLSLEEAESDCWWTVLAVDPDRSQHDESEGLNLAHYAGELARWVERGCRQSPAAVDLARWIAGREARVYGDDYAGMVEGDDEWLQLHHYATISMKDWIEEHA